MDPPPAASFTPTGTGGTGVFYVAPYAAQGWEEPAGGGQWGLTSATAGRSVTGGSQPEPTIEETAWIYICRAKPPIVTGASKGIGQAVTQALVDAGAYVIAGSRSRGPKLGALEEAGKVTFVASDLSIPDGADGLVAAAAEHGGVDVLVNNAGAVTVHPEGFASLTDDDWQASLGAERDGRRAHHQGRAACDVQAWRRVDRHRRIRQCLFPRSGHIRLLRHQGRRHEHREGIVKGIGAEEHSRQLDQPGTGVDRDVARRRRGRRFDRRRQWSDPGTDVRAQRQAPRRQAGSPHRNRSPIWSCSWPVTEPETSPVPT